MAEKSFTSRGLSRRGRIVILSAIIALATIGYVVGLGAGVPARTFSGFAGQARPGQAPGDEVVPALSYREVGDGALRDVAATPSWDELTRELIGEKQKPVTDIRARLVSLEQRAMRRAYNGAPPTVPHSVAGLSDQSCAACHGQGIRIDDRQARDMPHEFLANCTQCHARETSLGGVLAASSWRGMPAPVHGWRASPQAPPTVPHKLHMRSNCAACHGEYGWPGMQTSHPERRNCLQCHAPVMDASHPGRKLSAPQLLPAPQVRGQ